MDKTIALVVSATVILVSAVITITIGSGGLSDAQTGTDNIQSQGCDYQIQQAQDNPDYTEHMSSNCRDQYVQNQREQSFVGNTISQLGG